MAVVIDSTNTRTFSVLQLPDDAVIFSTVAATHFVVRLVGLDHGRRLFQAHDTHRLFRSDVRILLMVWIAACKGFYLHLERSGGFGAEGVSRTTTDAVVLSSVSVLVWDYLISALLL